MPLGFAERAQLLVGTPFRPQGRLPGIGLDCAGVVINVFGLQAEEIRCDYQLRGDHLAELDATLRRFFDDVGAGARCGDVLLYGVGDEQLHLAVHCGSTIVHADAARGKVMRTPAPPPWPLLQAYRYNSERRVR